MSYLGKNRNPGWLSGLGNLVAGWECDWTCQGYTKKSQRAGRRPGKQRAVSQRQAQQHTHWQSSLCIRHCSSPGAIWRVCCYSPAFFYFEGMMKLRREWLRLIATKWWSQESNSGRWALIVVFLTVLPWNSEVLQNTQMPMVSNVQIPKTPGAQERC